MTRTTSTTRALRSRREFMKLLAAGSAAVIASPATLAKARAAAAPAKATPAAAKPAAAPGARSTRARVEPGAHVALPAEIEKQKKYLADTLKTIRNHSLPPGSPQAFAFRALKSQRKRRNA